MAIAGTSTANGTSTTGTLPLGLIQTAIVQTIANPYETFSISISAGPKHASRRSVSHPFCLPQRFLL